MLTYHLTTNSLNNASNTNCIKTTLKKIFQYLNLNNYINNLITNTSNI